MLYKIEGQEVGSDLFRASSKLKDLGA